LIYVLVLAVVVRLGLESYLRADLGRATLVYFGLLIGSALAYRGIRTVRAVRRGPPR
jgi:hypothetical protein